MFTVEIPGGSATFREPSELNGEGRLLLNAAFMSAASAIAKIQEFTTQYPVPERPEDISDEEWAEIAAPNSLDRERHFPVLTLAESAAYLQVSHAVTVAQLKSWTLKRPLPTIGNFTQLDPELIDALTSAVDVHLGELVMNTDFTRPTDDDGKPISPNDPEFKESPTTGSGDSNKPPTQPQPVQPSQSTTTPGSDSVPSDGVPTSG